VAALGVPAEACLVIEDAPAGAAAARAAGMTVWAVTTTHDAAELSDADLVAADLPTILQRLNARERTPAG
jgi:sugar-phosphatase